MSVNLEETVCATNKSLGTNYKNASNMLASLYKTMSLRQIGELLGVSYPTIRSRLAAIGVPIKKRGGPNYRKSLQPERFGFNNEKDLVESLRHICTWRSMQKVFASNGIQVSTWRLRKALKEDH